VRDEKGNKDNDGDGEGPAVLCSISLQFCCFFGCPLRFGFPSSLICFSSSFVSFSCSAVLVFRMLMHDHCI
jgi:hypothetical protein